MLYFAELLLCRERYMHFNVLITISGYIFQQTKINF